MRTFNFLYGTIEFRMKIGGGSGDGAWPAVWMLDAGCQPSDPTGTDNNCNGQEIDIAEFIGYVNNVNQQIHVNSQTHNDGCGPSLSDATQNFHVYDLIWSPGSLVWQVDGTTTCTITQSYVPNAPMYVKISMFLGAGTINDSSLPWTTQVDYVKVTQGGSTIFFDDFTGGGTPPAITSATTASGTVGSAFSYQITATNTPTSYGATGLPAGLAVNTATGLISGTPTAAGTSTVTLRATNSGGTGNATLTLTISSTSPSISFVQAVASASSGSASSLSVSFPTNTVAGDLILVAFDFDTSATVSSVTDFQGNTFTQVGTQLTSPGGSRSRVYYAKNIQGGADTVNITLSANSSWLEVYLTEYSGVDRINPIDAQAGTSGGAGPVSSRTATTTVAGDIIYGYCLADWACTAGSDLTARSTFNNNLIEEMTAGSPGSYAATGTANNGWTMQMVALKPAR
ncbi:MAG: family 16 glycosylhydrolase [Acidobacteriia bacterium]|nr:family 16 glycosylhydrolase [Terriglobia bacterium]